MADFTVPLNRVGVVHISLIDPQGDHTARQVDNIDWSLGVESGNYPKFIGVKASIVHPAGRLV